jgi:FkbM family methyltransferase
VEIGRSTERGIMSVIAEQLAGKWNATRSLVQFMRSFRNWKDVWSAYRISAPAPSLEFWDGTVLHHGPGDDPIYLFREIFVDDCYLSGGFYEPRPGDTIVDVGANIGVFALRIEAQARGARVHCFEPGSAARETLERNVAANGVGEFVAIYPFAVSDHRGTVELTRTDSPMHRSMFVNDYAQGDAETVETLPLAEAIALTGARRVDLLKVDVEGAEIEIVEGMDESDWDKVDRAVVEFHDFFRPGCRDRVTRALYAAGFDRIEEVEEPTMAGLGLIRASRS